MSFVRAISQRAREVGRAIETPSPNRRALEGLAALLIQWAEGEGPAFWTEAAACAGRLRAAPGERRADGAGLAEDGSVPVARLFETHAAAGRALEEALLDVRAVLGSEEVEETLERAWALEAELSSPAGTALGTGAVSDVGVLAATLASQASRDNTSPEELEASSRWLLESVLAAVRDPAAFVPARSATLQGLSALRAKLGDRLERSEKAAALARAELAAPPRIDTDLERFAAAQDRAAMLAAARDASLRLGLQMEAVEAMEYADLESASDLSAMRDAVQVLAEEDAARPDSPPALRRLLDVWNSTAPSRSIGRAIQDVDRAAGAQEDLATKLRSTPAGNSRTLRLLARTERELARLVESARSALESLRASAGKAAEGLPAAVEQAGRARSALSLSSDLLFRASDAALGPRPAAASELPEPLVAEALAAAGKAASELSPLPELLESLRSPAAPEVAEGTSVAPLAPRDAARARRASRGASS
jgi:hypothetical protein